MRKVAGYRALDKRAGGEIPPWQKLDVEGVVLMQIWTIRQNIWVML